MLEFKNDNKAKINLVYKPPQKLQDDRYQVYKRYAQMKQGRIAPDGSNLENKWDAYEKQYEGWRPPKNPDDWQSNIVPPFTTTVVERALAEIIDQTLWPMIRARGPEDKPRAKILTYAKDYSWEIGDGDLQLYAGVKQALILGDTVWQEDYWQDKRQVRVLKKFDMEKNIEEYKKKTIYDFDDVYGENVNLRDFFKDEMARTINMGRYKANDCIRRYIMNFDTFQENFVGSIYDQFGDFKYVKPGGDLNHYQFYKPPEGIDKENQVEVLFYWARRPDKLIIVANDVVGRDGPNPYQHKQLPFSEGHDVPKMNSFYARGEPALLESIQDELTTQRRMRIDRQHIDIWKMFLVSNRESLDEDEAIVAPSRFLYVDDPRNSIVPLEYRDINPSAYMEEDRLKQDGREVTGMESPQPSTTATQAAIAKESTMKALRLKIWLLSRQLLTGIIRLRVPNMIQFYTTPKIEKIAGSRMAKYKQITTNDVALEIDRKTGGLVEKKSKGENFFVIEPSLITPQYGGFDYKMTGEPSFPISKPLQQQKVAEFMQHPVVQLAIQNGYYDVGKMADALSEINEFDPDEFKAEEQGGYGEQPMIDETQLLELANRENEIMLKGKRLEPTAYATRTHTDVHLAFMSSPEWKTAAQGNRAIVENFMYHCLGEEKAQQLRGQAKGGMGGGMTNGTPQNTEAQGIMAGEAKATMPGKVMGAELAPSGQMPK